MISAISCAKPVIVTMNERPALVVSGGVNLPPARAARAMQ